MKYEKTFLSSKYPIICAAMNQVSDYNLICAAAKAGLTPGIFYNQITTDELDIYMDQYYETNLIMSCMAEHFIKNYKYFLKSPVKYIEIVRTKSSISQYNFLFENFRARGKKVIIKGTNTYNVSHDVITLQGKESAGSGSDLATHDEFQKYKHKQVIVSGAVDTKEKIDYYISNGALAVSIGTLFAACSESRLSNDAKQVLISHSSKDLSRVGKRKKQGLIFNIEATDQYNFTDRLKAGVENPENGLIYCGESIDKITEIEPLQNIVARLTGQ